MKNVFDVNVNTNEYYGAAFFSRKVSRELETQLNAFQLQVHGLSKKVLPYFIAEIVLVTLIAVSFMGMFDGGISEILEFSWKTWVIVCLIAVLAVLHFGNKHRKDVFEDRLNTKYALREAELQQRAREELQIPENRLEVEVLSSPYELVKDRKYMKHKDYFDNLIVDVYQRNDSLCFFDGIQEIAIPFETIDFIRIVRKKIAIEEWLKEVEYNESPYKKYHVRPRMSNNQGYLVHSYYQILIDSNSEEFEILVPDYEEESMRKIVDMVKPYKQ